MKKCVYLIENKEKNLFKIGFTTNILNRRRHYKTHNPESKILAYVEVNEKYIEESVRMSLKKKGYKITYGREWFTGSLNIRDFRNLVKETNERRKSWI